MQTIGWRPYTIDSRRAGVRYRCLNPMRDLKRMGLRLELYDATQPNRYAVVIVQGLSCLEQAEGSYGSGDRFIEEVRRLKNQGTTILADDCDNHFYNPGDASEWTHMARRLRVLLDLADGWIASTPQVAAVFAREAAQRKPVTIIGDGLEAESFLRAGSKWRDLFSPRQRRDGLRARLFSRRLANDGATHLVWFGSHGSSYANGGMADLLQVKDQIESVGRETPLTLTVISNSRAKFDKHIANWSIPTCYHEWNHVGFSRVLRAHDVALIPVERSEFTDCKTNNRIVTALSHGLAVVADGIPSYRDFRAVTSLDNWTTGLRSYALNPVSRRTHARLGQALIAESWTADKIAQQWRQVLEPYLAVARAAGPQVCR